MKKIFLFLFLLCNLLSVNAGELQRILASDTSTPTPDGCTKVVFVKGDLHQSSTTYGRRFTYKSVGSLFGSSEWIHKNFGNTLACTDYSIVDGAKIIDGRIVLQ